jgi:hypothetical protein
MASGGATSTGAARAAARAEDNWVRPRADVERWVARAAPGEAIVYGRGFSLPRNETSLLVRELALGGAVDPHQSRPDPSEPFEFSIRKRDPSTGSGQALLDGAAAAAQDEDPYLDAVLRAFRRCANLNQRAPSDSALVRLAGLETIGQAKWRVRKLVACGAIRTVPITTGPDAGSRIVEIIEQGRVIGRTRAPASFEAAAAQVRQEPIDRGRDRAGRGG